MISFDRIPPDEIEALCTPMHRILSPVPALAPAPGRESEEESEGEDEEQPADVAPAAGTKPQTPASRAKTPSAHTSTPGARSKTPGASREGTPQARTSAARAQTPGTKTETAGAQTKTPPAPARTPAPTDTAARTPTSAPGTPRAPSQPPAETVTPGAQTEASGARAPTGALYLGSMAALGEPALLRTHAIRHLVQVLDVPWAPQPELDGGPSSPSPSDVTSPEADPAADSPLLHDATHAADSPHAAGRTKSAEGTNGVTRRTKPSPMSYHRIDLADSTSAASAADLHAALPDACAYIAAALDKGENVLVHCHQGVSRSASIVIAFLIHDHHMSYDGAHALVRGRRLCVRPNKGFEGALREWEGECREDARASSAPLLSSAPYASEGKREDAAKARGTREATPYGD